LTLRQDKEIEERDDRIKELQRDYDDLKSHSNEKLVLMIDEKDKKLKGGWF
jgi:hypothetical protein